MSEYDSDGDSSDVECPTCGKESKSYRGMKIHHTREHGESIAGEEVSCAQCGDTKHIRRVNVERSKNHFCDRGCKSKWESENQRGVDHHQYDRVKVLCAQCGDIKHVPEHKVDSNKRHFCDRNCMGKYRSENIHGENHHCHDRIEVACAQCGDTKRVVPSRANYNKRHFCNLDCMGKWQSENYNGRHNPSYGRVEVECAQCGDTKRITQSVAENTRQNFCDLDCFGEWMSENWSGESNPNWKGGMFPYGPGWTEAKRERVRERQNRTCAGCGVCESENGRRLDVHHIAPARSFKDDAMRNDESNLVAVCRSCHQQWEVMAPLRPQTPYLD